MRATDPERGAFFQRGEAELFAAFRGGRIVGTIAAAMDRTAIDEKGQSDCIFGFFESIDEQDVADALFAKAAEWGERRGLTTLFGPFDLDYEDAYGILTDGRDRKPVILCGHTPAYYQKLVEAAGFAPARPGNIALAIDLTTPSDQIERIRRAAHLAARRGRYVIRPVNLADFHGEARRIHHLLNNSLWEEVQGTVPWPIEAVEELTSQFRRIADPDLVLFADIASGPEAGRTVGWFAAVPNVNEILEHAHGLRYPWHYLSLLANLRRTPKCLAAKSLLVLPEHHSTGVAALLFNRLYEAALAKGYEWVDLSLTSEGNPQTPVIAERAGAVVYKRYQVYRRAIVS